MGPLKAQITVGALHEPAALAVVVALAFPPALARSGTARWFRARAGRVATPVARNVRVLEVGFAGIRKGRGKVATAHRIVVIGAGCRDQLANSIPIGRLFQAGSGVEAAEVSSAARDPWVLSSLNDQKCKKRSKPVEVWRKTALNSKVCSL